MELSAGSCEEDWAPLGSSDEALPPFFCGAGRTGEQEGALAPALAPQLCAERVGAARTWAAPKANGHAASAATTTIAPIVFRLTVLTPYLRLD